MRRPPAAKPDRRIAGLTPVWNDPVPFEDMRLFVSPAILRALNAGRAIPLRTVEQRDGSLRVLPGESRSL